MKPAVPKSGRLSTKTLTSELRKLADQMHTIDDEGNPITNEAALAQLVWKMALGYVEKDEQGKETYHKPAAWAIQYIYERMDGKVPQAIAEEETRVKAAEKVRSMAKERINALAAKSTQ